MGKSFLSPPPILNEVFEVFEYENICKIHNKFKSANYVEIRLPEPLENWKSHVRGRWPVLFNFFFRHLSNASTTYFYTQLKNY